MMKNVSACSLAKSLLAPLTATVIIPLLILYSIRDIRIGWGLGINIVVGILIWLAGLYFIIITIKLFAQIGKGTLMPWVPTQKLVVAGPYRYVRNPMYTGIFFSLLGEAAIFGSISILAFLLCLLPIVHLFIIFNEEPGLVKRFGEEYVIYRKNVPRWIPRLTPWTGSTEKDSAIE